MCGIVGILGKDDVAASIVDGLKRLEYRGYDSAGIATLDHGRIERRRAPGKLANLAKALEVAPLSGKTGIGHTRWATHGAPTEINAHPHATDRVAIVHNGIIENYASLREELKVAGREFHTQTDSEVIAQLLTHYLEHENLKPRQAFRKTLDRLTGAFGLVVLISGEDDLMLAAREGSPLAIGRGDGEMFVASDAYALAPFSNRVTYLDEGDMAVVTRSGATIYDAHGGEVARPEKISSVVENMVDKDGHRHFMAKEIHEQPEVIAHTLSRYIDGATNSFHLENRNFSFRDLDRLIISGCGTAYIAGLIARYWFESLAGLPVEIDIASELRYRDYPYSENGGALFISQSGETADTLAALKNARQHGQRIAAVVNVPESSIAREADTIFPMAAGPEIGVASTKAFTCQLAALAAVAIAAGQERGFLSAERAAEAVKALMAVPRLVGEALHAAPQIEEIGRDLAAARDVLYLGRGVSYPLALEGALKLKEISYIHAEGYAAGELKHGPIALIDDDMPVVAICPPDRHFAKSMSNLEEVMARKGKAILISDRKGIKAAPEGLWHAIEVPETDPLLSPIVYAAPIQLLAYYTATAKGTDVDQPRNLAKSVTVE